MNCNTTHKRVDNVVHQCLYIGVAFVHVVLLLHLHLAEEPLQAPRHSALPFALVTAATAAPSVEPALVHTTSGAEVIVTADWNLEAIGGYFGSTPTFELKANTSSWRLTSDVKWDWDRSLWQTTTKPFRAFRKATLRLHIPCGDIRGQQQHRLQETVAVLGTYNLTCGADLPCEKTTWEHTLHIQLPSRRQQRLACSVTQRASLRVRADAEAGGGGLMLSYSVTVDSAPLNAEAVVGELPYELPGTLTVFMQTTPKCLSDPQQHTVLVGGNGTVASTSINRLNGTASHVALTAHVDLPDHSGRADVTLCMKHQLPSQMAVYTSVRLYQNRFMQALLTLADTPNCTGAQDAVVQYCKGLLWCGVVGAPHTNSPCVARADTRTTAG